jgi:uncharacterized membrane protein YkoI
MTMLYRSSVVLALSLLMPLVGSAQAGPHRGEHEAAYSAARSGNILPFPEIKHRVMPRMGDASLMGFDYDERAAIYTLKLMRGGSVIWVDVDARTGTIIGRSGE